MIFKLRSFRIVAYISKNNKKQKNLDEIKAAMEWMEKNNPVDEGDDEAEQSLGENWRYCFKYRMESIKSKNGDVDEVMKMWPVLQCEYGVGFVSEF